MHINRQQVASSIGLDYAKLILAKVSFSAPLFEKELKKAIASLLPHEIQPLREWCYLHFYEMYGTVLQHCFVSSTGLAR